MFVSIRADDAIVATRHPSVFYLLRALYMCSGCGCVKGPTLLLWPLMYNYKDDVASFVTILLAYNRALLPRTGQRTFMSIYNTV